MRAFEDILAGPAPSLARSQIGMRLDMAFLDLLEQIGGTLIDDTLARGDATRAAILARSAIAVDPYRERWHEALIRAHLQRGEVAAAHSSLSHYQTTLRSELGIPAPKAIEALVATATAG
jgi:DNA-binding SARP family transcriptional activator